MGIVCGRTTLHELLEGFGVKDVDLSMITDDTPLLMERGRWDSASGKQSLGIGFLEFLDERDNYDYLVDLSLYAESTGRVDSRLFFIVTDGVIRSYGYQDWAAANYYGANNYQSPVPHSNNTRPWIWE
jgi:hypothetical protein